MISKGRTEADGMTRKLKGNDRGLAKSPSGINGLDEITGGGLPKGRPTLICGSAGAGKTLFAMEFLVRGATEHNEPGVFVSFEELPQELTQNVASLGFDLDKLQQQRKLSIDFVRVERSEIEETGEYDLEGLFVRLGYAIDSIKAKRVVLDTIETLFAGLSNASILRAELRRLFRWLKDKGVTAIITGERGEGQLTRHGLEEYVSDCVILLDHRVIDQVSTRRLRVVKYRGSTHGTNEYPFLIEADGISVMPVTSMGLQHEVSRERVPSGIPALDEMLGGEGFYCGSSVLISGTAGTGKTSISSRFAEASCQRGEKVLYFAFEESPGQIMRNMASIGIHLAPYLKKGLLRYEAMRPMAYGLEMHLARMHKMIEEFGPATVVIDPVSNLSTVGTTADVTAMLVRLIDFLKGRQITAVLTNLTNAGGRMEATDAHISSLIDTWILLRDIELGGERNRGLYILKSRGMAHSNQIREFRLNERGINLVPVYVGPEGVLTGSARLSQEAREEAVSTTAQQEVERRQRELDRKRTLLEAQMASLKTQFEAEEDELRMAIQQAQQQREIMQQQREQMARSRKAGGNGNTAKRSKRSAK
jgi:circadian clock protein KaiC